MRNMSKKTWKLRVWNHMTEMQKLDILLKHAKIPHTYGRRWPEMDSRTIMNFFRADDTMVASKSLHMMLLEIVSGMAFGVGVPMVLSKGLSR